MSRFLRAIVGGAVVLGSARPAVAAEAAPVDVAFVFRAACGSSADFAAKVEARTEGLRLRSVDDESPVVIVLEEEQGRSVARLTLRLEDGRLVERSLTAESCEEAFEAIAFVTALALDPDSVARSPRPLVPSQPAGTAPGAEAPPPAPTPEPRFLLRVGPAFVGAVGATPSVLLGGGLGFEAGREGNGFAPWLRVAVSQERTDDAVTSAGRAYFERTLARVELCGVRLGTPIVGVRLCGHVALGHFLAEGRATEEPERASRLWGEAGGAGALEVRLGAGLLWSSALSVGVPWTRGAFRFDEEVFFETSPVAFGVSSGLFLEFR